jgi:hypothetical protein
MDRRQDPHSAKAIGALQQINRINPAHQLRPRIVPWPASAFLSAFFACRARNRLAGRAIGVCRKIIIRASGTIRDLQVAEGANTPSPAASCFSYLWFEAVGGCPGSEWHSVPNPGADDDIIGRKHSPANMLRYKLVHRHPAAGA